MQQPPLVHVQPTKRITFSSRPNVQSFIGNVAGGSSSSLPSPGKGLSWYATETKDALEAYDRARRGQALPPNHGGSSSINARQQASATVAVAEASANAAAAAVNAAQLGLAPGSSDKLTEAEISRMNDHIFRVWVGGAANKGGAAPVHSPHTAGHAAEQQQQQQQQEEYLEDNRRDHAFREFSPESTAGGRRGAGGDSGTESASSTSMLEKSARSGGGSAPMQQAKILGYTPKDSLKRTVDLSKVKSRIDTGRTTKRNGMGMRPKPSTGPRRSTGSHADHLHGTKGRTVSSGSISRRQKTARLTGQLKFHDEDDTPMPYRSAPDSPRRPSKRNNGSRTPNTVRRKLDLSNAVPKVDTGRTKRHTPGGGKFNIPLGRMPLSKKVTGTVM